MEKGLYQKIIIMAVALCFPLFTFGQTFSPNEELEIFMSPQNPEPGATVSLTINSNFKSLGDFFVAWSKDSIREREGIGEVRHQSKVGRLGELSTFRATVTDSEGTSKVVSLNVIPAEVSLVVEADSYTPMFYKGKGLPSHQSEVKVVAIPHLLSANGVRIDDKNLFYDWQLDGRTDSKQSGIGKNIFRLYGKLISRPQTVSLVVSSSDDEVKARKTVRINFRDPEILIYEKSPLTGIKRGAPLSLGIIEETEGTFIMEPFYFSKKALLNRSLEYKWVIDGEEFPSLAERREVTFAGDVVGGSNVSIEVLNPRSLLQRAKSLFRVIVNREQ